ncbi:thiamine phosphate synthase [Aidingimonas halophila]|uniref:Thiamine-phosphate synthase n=1 Tax=Aidingimonas halophila TaxID=574349 RepID=A0A1H2XL93_9GAMM|nr:thiamine phosphate synthase [Aidingimonas halophila]GHC28944.1 thiamine-phosphate synthase [Aidingimonas halophila]SDW93663.1 thiamine-phosphate diphosphorylase [Aidingimonas halophila]
MGFRWTQGLYAITDETLLPDDPTLLSACEQALQGGLALLQYRDKSADGPKRWRQAQALAALCRGYGVPLIINDDLELTCRLQQKGHRHVGLHLGQEDGALSDARKRLGEQVIIGATCHDRLDLAEQAAREGASYLAFGRFFTSSTKPGAPPADPCCLRKAARFGLPRVAIGGINGENMSVVKEAGADLIAMVSGIFGQENLKSCVERLNRRLDNRTFANDHG